MLQRPSRKRQRPWTSTSSVVTVAIYISSAFLASADLQNVQRQEEEMILGKVESGLGLSSNSRLLGEITPSSSPLSFFPPTNFAQNSDNCLFKQSFPVNFNVALNLTQSVDLNEVLRETRTVLEIYLLQGLEKFQSNTVIVKGARLAATLLGPRLRRSMQSATSRAIAIQLDGGVQVDVQPDINTDMFAVRQLISSEISNLVQNHKVQRAIYDSDIRSLLNRGGSYVNRSSVNGNSNAVPQSADQNKKQLQKPSLLSIVFGFILVAVATAGLCIYGYIFYRKRKKRLRRLKQMKESIPYTMPSTPSRKFVTPATPQNLPLPPPISKIDDDSDISSYKGVGSDDEGPADDFARELQLAASLDEQAWEDFQRKKQQFNDQGRIVNRSSSAEEGYSSNPGFGSVATYDAKMPINSGSSTMDPEALESPRWAKSFPYGDEQDNDDDFPIEQGIEWTPEGMSDEHGNSWEQYSSQTPEKLRNLPNDEETQVWDDSQNVRLEPESNQSDQQPVSISSSAAIQAIERDLAQYGTDPDDTSKGTDSLLTSEIVEEVEKLSKFVKRYEQRKERRLKRERERQNRSSDSGMSNDYEETSSDPPGTSRLFDGRTPESARYGAEKVSTLNSSNEEVNIYDHPKPSYGMLQDEKKTDTNSSFGQGTSQGDIRDNSISDPESDVEETSVRLGITPFRVQKRENVGFDGGPISPMMQKLARAEASRVERDGEESWLTDERRNDHIRSNPQSQNSSRESNFSLQQFGQQNPSRENGQKGREPGISSQEPHSLSNLRGNNAVLDTKSHLKALRANNAIVDSSQSDVNFSMVPSDEEPERTTRSVPKLDPPRGSSGSGRRKQKSNEKFNSIRTMFESRTKGAIFPPDEHWQYTY